LPTELFSDLLNHLIPAVGRHHGGDDGPRFDHLSRIAVLSGGAGRYEDGEQQGAADGVEFPSHFPLLVWEAE
jgi:hypothetical protein